MMILEAKTDADICPSYEIAAYIDGEIGAQRELELETHFALCSVCKDELNHQKHFLCALNSSLRNEGEIDLPENFTKQIVANVESRVVGLRGPHERYNAIFIVAALFLFVLFALGSDASSLIGGLANAVEKVAAVGGFLGKMIYSLLVGTMVILRSLAAPFQTGLVIAVVGFGALAATAALLAKMIFRLRRI